MTTENIFIIPKNKILLFSICFIFLIFSNISKNNFSSLKIKSANAQILFEDSFNNQNDWTHQQSSSQAQSCYPGGTDTVSCTSWNLPTGWDGARDGFSMCTYNAPGYNNMYIDAIPGYPAENSGSCYGNSGKCLTFWEEACQLSQGSYDDSDKSLSVMLDNEYQDLYIRWRMKYSSDWQWGTNGLTGGSPMWKLAHIQRMQYGTNPYSYFTNNNCVNSPVAVPTLGSWLGDVNPAVDLSDPLYTTLSSRCFGGTDSDCNSNNYYCVDHRSWSDNSDSDVVTTIGNLGSNLLITGGQWHTYEIRIKTNTYSQGAWNTDGVVQVWIDGTLVKNKTGVEVFFANAPTNPPRGYNFISFGGNNNNDFVKSDDTADGEQWYAIDDVVIGTSYIGPDYTIGGIPSDTTPPTGSININSNATYASSTSVSLNISASDSSGVESMKVSETNAFSSSVERVYSSLLSFTLSAGDGIKNIFAWFKDTLGNWSNANTTSTITDTIILDTTAPSISSVSSSGVTSSSAIITWTTNESASSQVDYGTSVSYGQTSSTTGTRTSHSRTLSSLSADTAYHFRVKSIDSAGNTTNSSDYTFTTLSTTPAVVTCTSFTYSSWGTCQSNSTQTRTVVTSLPSGCVNGTPVLSQSCVYTSSGASGGSSSTTTSGTKNIATSTTNQIATSTTTQIATSTKVITIATTTVDVTKTTNTNTETKIDLTKTENISTLYGQSTDIVKRISLQESQTISGYKNFVTLLSNEIEIFKKLSTQYLITELNKYSIAKFIHDGTPTTLILGAGERAGVIGSFSKVFKRTPSSEKDWQDVIKIANGRWPEQTDSSAEEKTKNELFTKIYKRSPNMNQPNDNAAVTIITYGLRPVTRNTESEKNGIKIFRDIFKYSPTSSLDWDIVRAIAYSGAVR